MLDGRDVAEEITTADKEKYPHYSTDDIVMSKGQVVHFADAGNEGCKGTNNRHEAGQENSLVTMLVIKCAGFVYMLLFDNVLLNHVHTEMLAYHIIAGVAQHSRN